MSACSRRYAGLPMQAALRHRAVTMVAHGPSKKSVARVRHLPFSGVAHLRAGRTDVTVWKK